MIESNEKVQATLLQCSSESVRKRRTTLLKIIRKHKLPARQPTIKVKFKASLLQTIHSAPKVLISHQSLDYCGATQSPHYNNVLSDWLMEREMYKGKLLKENKELWDLVRPDDEDWEFNFTDMSDFDRIFQKITSVPNWKQDMSLVYLFNVLLQRKHKYFNESCFEEDLVIVPSLEYINRPRPNTEGLSEQQRKFYLLVHDFVASAYSIYHRAAYDQIYQQFYAIKGWEKNRVLARLYSQVKLTEAVLSEQIRPRAPQLEQEQNEAIQAASERWVNTNKQAVEERCTSEKGQLLEQYIKCLLVDLHLCKNWRHNDTLRKWNGILGTQLRVLRMKKQGTWQSRIVHQQSQIKRGLIQRIWNKIWPGTQGEESKDRDHNN